MGQKIINRKSEQVTNYLHCTLRDIKNRSAFAIGAIELIMENENRSFRDIQGKVKFQARLRAKNSGGKQKFSSNSLTVANADTVVLMISIGTNYIKYNDISGDPEGLQNTPREKLNRITFHILRQMNKAFPGELHT
jgi:hypothetical protein